MSESRRTRDFVDGRNEEVCAGNKSSDTELQIEGVRRGEYLRELLRLSRIRTRSGGGDLAMAVLSSKKASKIAVSSSERNRGMG